MTRWHGDYDDPDSLLARRGKLVGVGRAHTRRRVIVLVADLDIRVLSEEGELLRHLTLDPEKDYQPLAPKAKVT